MTNYRFFILLTVLAVFAACSRTSNPNIRMGSHLDMVEGQPEMLLSSIGYIDENNEPVIDVALDIIYGSLIYSEMNGVYHASVMIETEIYRLLDESEEEYERVELLREILEVEDASANVTDSRDSFPYHERIQTVPGKYMVIVQVTDRDSGKSARRRSNVTVLDPESDTPNLTHIKVLGSDRSVDAIESPLTMYSIPGRIDTINFEYQVTRPENYGPLAVRTRLIKFESDTLPAYPMSGPTPSLGSLQFRGINYDRREVLERQERILEQESGTITIEYKTERPSRGNYRFEVEIGPPENDNENVMFKARDFSSMSDNFPFVESVSELARPLVYLMRRDRYREMMKVQERDALKREIDRFWLSHLGDKDLAARVIEMYYQRVEEANKQFSNFKEGWMTDMGMVYVLFGQPWAVERSMGSVVWIYGYDRSNPQRVFYFERTRMSNDAYPFENYILRRQYHHHGAEYEQIQRWLTGTILTRPI